MDTFSGPRKPSLTHFDDTALGTGHYLSPGEAGGRGGGAGERGFGAKQGEI